MLVNDSNRDIFFRGAKTACPDAFMAAETTWSQLAMRIASTAPERLVHERPRARACPRKSLADIRRSWPTPAIITA